jgi:hypothetical protein
VRSTYFVLGALPDAGRALPRRSLQLRFAALARAMMAPDCAETVVAPGASGSLGAIAYCGIGCNATDRRGRRREAKGPRRHLANAG